VAHDVPIASDGYRHLMYQLSVDVTMLRSLSTMLKIAKESYNEPLKILRVDITRDLRLQCGAISAASGREIKLTTHGSTALLSLNQRSYANLMNVVMNLLQNATQNSPHRSEVELIIERREDELILSVENLGFAISKKIIDEAQVAVERGDYFRGLPRSCQLAARNGWELDYVRLTDKNRLTLTVPYGLGAKGA
jgi:signal transduction histidine kinase